MAKLMLDMGDNLAMFKGHPDELVEQEVNAQVMAPEAMDRLAENIKREHRLEQLPFAVQRADGTHELISGHHRKRAAKAAGLEFIYWLSDTRADMTRGTVVAKQLAHNSLKGESDKETLKFLFAELDTVDNIIESFVQPVDFDDVQQLEPAEATQLALDIELKCLTLVFTPAVLESLDRLQAWCERKIPDEVDVVGVLPNDLLQRVRSVMLNVAKVEDVRSLGTVFARMCEICEAHLAGSEQKVLPAAKEPGTLAA